jgi:hypothetical protein
MSNLLYEKSPETTSCSLGEYTAMSIQKQFSKEVRGNLHYFPVWEPGQATLPGAVGEIVQGVFHAQTSLEKLFPHLKVDVNKEDRPNERRGFQSKGCIQTKISGSGGALAGSSGLKIEADGEIAFSRAGAAVLDSSDLTYHRITNLHEVRSYLTSRRYEWPRGYVLVSHVEEAANFGVVISNSESTVISLSGGAEAIAKCWLAGAGVSIRNIHDSAYTKFGSGPLFLRLYGFHWYSRKPRLLAAHEDVPDGSEVELAEISASDPQFED